MTIQVVTLVREYKNRVWIEDDLLGDRHVMIQSDAPGSSAECYATFHYAYPYANNSSTLAKAEECAISLGATSPVERRTRGI
jgi:hypothetical protein